MRASAAFWRLRALTCSEEPGPSRSWLERAGAPSKEEYDAVTLERGVTQDLEFEAWANKVWDLGVGLGSEVSLKDFRKNVILELLNEAGQPVMAYDIPLLGV